jgi:hypothetical protein
VRLLLYLGAEVGKGRVVSIRTKNKRKRINKRLNTKASSLRYVPLAHEQDPLIRKQS